MKTSEIVPIVKETFNQWWTDNVPRLSAALAYYTVFSMAPLLVITIAVAGLVFGREAASGELFNQIGALMGQEGAKAIQSILQSANKPATGTLALIAGVATLVFGASGAFVALQDSLNTIWGVKPGSEQSGIFALLKSRLLSFAMVLGIGFLLLVSLVISAALAAAGKYMGGVLPIPAFVFEALNFVVSLGIVTFLFALIYKVLPDADYPWRYVWLGAAMSAALFTLGKFLIGLYLGKSSVASAFGAAGSLIIVLVWVYYSSQLVLFGAEFTQVYVNRFGPGSRPKANCVQVHKCNPADQQQPTPAPGIAGMVPLLDASQQLPQPEHALAASGPSESPKPALVLRHPYAAFTLMGALTTSLAAAVLRKPPKAA